MRKLLEFDFENRWLLYLVFMPTASILGIGVPLIFPGLQRGVLTFVPLLPFVAIICFFGMDFRKFKSEVAGERRYCKKFNELSVERINAGIRSAGYDAIIGMVGESIRARSPVSNRIVEQVVHDARNMAYQPREAVVGPARQEIAARLTQLNVHSNVALRLGILGTFIGFVYSLSALAAVFKDFEDIAASNFVGVALGQLFGGIRTAFITSIGGLIVAIVITAIVHFERSRLPELSNLMSDVAGDAEQLGRAVNITDPLVISGLASVRSALDQNSERLRSHASIVASELSDHLLGVREQSNKIGSITDEIKVISDHWGDVASAIIEAQAKTMVEVTEALHSVKQSTEQAAQSAAAGFQLLSVEQQIIRERIQDWEAAREQAKRPLLEATEAISEQFFSILSNLESTTDQFSKSVEAISSVSVIPSPEARSNVPVVIPQSAGPVAYLGRFLMGLVLVGLTLYGFLVIESGSFAGAVAFVSGLFDT